MSSACTPVRAKVSVAPAPRLHLREKVSGRRQQVPRIAAQVLEVEAERLGAVAREDLLRAPQQARFDRYGRQPLGGDTPLVVGRVHADERALERRHQHLCPREDAELTLLGERGGREPHLAAAEEHEPGDPAFAFDGEHGAFGEREPEVLGVDDQVVGGELARRAHVEPEQPFDRRQAFAADDPPRVRGAIRWPTYVERGGEDAGAAGGLDEELDDETVAVPRRRAFERRAVTFECRRARGVGDEEARGEVIDLLLRDVHGEERGVGVAIHALQRRLEAHHDVCNRIVGSRSLGVQRAGERQGARECRKEPRHYRVLDAKRRGFRYGHYRQRRQAAGNEHGQVVEQLRPSLWRSTAANVAHPSSFAEAHPCASTTRCRPDSSNG